MNKNLLNKEKLVKCEHYKRNSQIQCIDCKKFYGCRFCHDENEGHDIDKFKINHMKCKICLKEQPISNICIECDSKMAHYYCDICHLFDDDQTKIINHCDKCGICRIGDNKHCDKCNMCFSKEGFDSHKCIDASKYNDDCVICLESLKNSRNHTTIIKCGHLIHMECLNDFIRSNQYQCPLCKKSIVDMSHNWEIIENYVNSCEMPEEYKNKMVNVFCNDCEKKSLTNYHFTYNQCQECNSWNTEILNIINS